MIENAVIITELSFSYEKKLILDNLSASFPKNSICFIMGNNGSGKTTLLKNLMGFLTPQNGSIIIENNSIANYDKTKLSKLISYVPQAIRLNTDFTVIDYLSLGRTPHLDLLSKLKDSDYSIIESFSQMLGIDNLYDATFNKLSGGQKQIIAIARSLIQDTPIIIMDEPMSALDIGKQVEVLKILHKLKESKTIILTTHNPNHALAIESNSYFMKNGKIIYFGESKKIIQNELIQNVFGNNISLNHGKDMDSIVFVVDKK